ncbi:MAG: NAD(P)-dependent oxidoreductase [Chloroflexota bacterium]
MIAGQRALVTGAGGFVGRHIVAAALRAGWAVVAADWAFDPDLRATWAELPAERLTLVEGDLASLPPLAVEAVVHAAAVTAGPDESGQMPEENFRANLEPALAVLAWAARQGVRRTVLLSSSAVFRATRPGLVDETLPPSPYGLYAVAKLALEGLAETLRGQHGRDVIAARLSNLYGPGEIARPTRPRLSLVGRMVRDAVERGAVAVYQDEPPRDWTFVPDVGEAIVRLLECPALRHALYHVAAGQVLAPGDIAATIRQMLPGVRVEWKAGPEPGATPLTRQGTLVSERLRAETGFAAWTPFANGLQQVIDWHLDREVVR